MNKKEKVTIEWKSMETAPLDGTDVLLFSPYLNANDTTISICYWTDINKKWVMSDSGCAEQGPSYLYHPTHWAHLPAHPDYSNFPEYPE